MQYRYGLLIAAACCAPAITGIRAQAQTETSPAPPIFKSETRMVLVDAVVADKKGNYIQDLTQKDFHVYEDKEEQEIKSFSFEADPASPLKNQPHYMVLFFDDSTMDLADQMQARQAAAKFIDRNTGPNRFIAVVNFTGSLQITQNFTEDADRLRKAVTGIKLPSVATSNSSSGGAPNLSAAELDFGIRDSNGALRTLARSLGGVPGRKTLILLTSGYPTSPEYITEIETVIDVCNKANVAIYPIDVRALIATPAGGAASGGAELRVPGSPGVLLAGSDPAAVAGLIARILASYPLDAAFQRGGGGVGGGGGGVGGGRGGTGTGPGGGTGGGTGGGGKGPGTGTGTGGGTGKGGTGTTPGTGAGRGGATANPGAVGLNNLNPLNAPNNLIPPIPPSSSTNQAIMYMLASGTGGFVIVNTNDLLGGLERIAREQNQYYILGYTPPEGGEGACHTLKVKVDRGGTTVRSRTGYCNVKPVDFLSGNQIEKDLEKRATAALAGNVTASIQAPFFYTSPNVARVNVAMEIPGAAIDFAKAKGKLHADMNILGIAYRADGSVAARFSDTLKLDLDNKKELKQFQEQPVHYETQFDVASGKYALKVVFSAGGESFGKLETPLVIDSYDLKEFSISGIALSKNLHKVTDLTLDRDLDMIADRTPLVAQGMQIIPAGTNRFQKSGIAVIYAEVYEPLLTHPNPPGVGIQMRVLDRKTGQQKADSGLINLAKVIQAGNSVVPVGLKIPIETLEPGAYRAEVKAMDTQGHWSTVRTADFDVE